MKVTAHELNTDVPRADLYHADHRILTGMVPACDLRPASTAALSRHHAPSDHSDRRAGPVGRQRSANRRQDRRPPNRRLIVADHGSDNNLLRSKSSNEADGNTAPVTA